MGAGMLILKWVVLFLDKIMRKPLNYIPNPTGSDFMLCFAHLVL